MLMRCLATRIVPLALACLLGWATCVPGPPALAQNGDPTNGLPAYEVQDGDTLLGIAARFGVPVEVLLALNNLEDRSELIFVGQELFLPSFAELPQPDAGCATQHVVVEGDTLWNLAVGWGVTVDQVRALNGLQPGDLLLVGRTVCGPEAVAGTPEAGQNDVSAPPRQPDFDPGWVIHPAESFWYTVNLGDTLAWVSARYGLTAAALAETNELRPDDDVQPGQLLLVPASEGNGKPWTARYWAVPDLSGEPLLTRAEDAVAHNWLNDAPTASLPADSFSAEWRGDFDFAGASYRFIGLADHGVRVYLDEELLLDSWSGETAGPLTIDALIEEGTHSVRVEYWEDTGPAMVYVLWFQSVSDNAE